MNDNHDQIIPFELENNNAVKPGPFNEDRSSSDPQTTVPSEAEKAPGESHKSPLQPSEEADFSEVFVDPYDPVHSDISEDEAATQEQLADFRALGFGLANRDKNAEVDALQATLPPTQRWYFGRYMVIPSGHLSIDAGS